MLRMETVIELKWFNSGCSRLSSYWNWTIGSLSSHSKQQYLSQLYPPPSYYSRHGKFCFAGGNCISFISLHRATSYDKICCTPLICSHSLLRHCHGLCHHGSSASKSTQSGRGRSRRPPSTSWPSARNKTRSSNRRLFQTICTKHTWSLYTMWTNQHYVLKLIEAS